MSESEFESTLLRRLKSHIRNMRPKHKRKASARLLIEAAAEIERLQRESYQEKFCNSGADR